MGVGWLVDVLIISQDICTLNKFGTRKYHLMTGPATEFTECQSDNELNKRFYRNVRSSRNIYALVRRKSVARSSVSTYNLHLGFRP